MRKKSWGEYNKNPLDIIIEKIRTSKISKNIKKGSIMLDLGCGFKAPFLTLESSKIKKGVGIDISVANSSVPKNIILIKGRADSNINLKSGQFDIVTALALIEHVDYPSTMLDESYRLLKKGGRILLTTPSKYSKPLLELLAHKLHVISSDEISDHKRYYDKNSLKDVLKKSGFRNIKVGYFAGLNLFAEATK